MKTPLLFLPIVILFLSNIFGQERLHSHKDVSQKINQQQKIIQDISTNENKILTKDETDVILKDKQLEMVGGIIKNDFMINDDTIGYSDQRFPTISVNASGDFVVAWSDYRNDKWDIYFQRYNKFGVKQGLNTQVYSSAGNSDKLYPTVSMDMFGNFIIAWQENKNGNWDIYFCGFDNNGAPRGIIMKVNDDNGNSYQQNPSVSVNKEGNFIIAWQDERNGDNDIYYQRYNKMGSKIGINEKVNDDMVNSHQLFPEVSMDDEGNFIIVWQDFRNGNWDIYFQGYDSMVLPGTLI